MNVSGAAPTRLAPLTSMRAFAAFWVVVHHYGADVLPFSNALFIARNGHLAVSFFFALSGFIMVWNYRQQAVPLAAFWRKRLLRLIPATYMALLLSYVALYGGDALHIIADGEGQAASLVYNILFLQGWFPGFALTPNLPSWSLSAEALFYGTFPALIAAQRWRGGRLFAIGVAVLFTWVYLAQYWLRQHYGADNGDVRRFFAFHPLSHLQTFLLGMLAAAWWTRLRPERTKWLHPALMLALLGALLWAAGPETQGLWMAASELMFIGLILSTVRYPGVILSWRPLVILGEISFGTYIYQLPVNRLCSLANERWHLSAGTFFWLFVAVLHAVAALSFYAVELPVMRRWGRA